MRIFRTIFQIVSFILFYLEKFIKANFSVAYDVLTPKHYMKPGIVKVPLNVTKDIEILMLNNLITMTPGTICVNIKSDKSTMYVHAMYINNRDELIKEIKTIEFKILTLFHHD